MAKYILLGIAAGLTSAALYATVFTGSVAALLMFYIAPLPLFVVGLGWGAISAGAGAVAGALALALAIDPKFGFVFAITVALAPAILSHLALRSRPVLDATGDPTGNREWYPEGGLVVWTAGLGIAILAATLVVTGLGPEKLVEIAQQYKQLLHELAAGNEPEMQRMKEQFSAFIEWVPPYIPAISASIWLFSNLINMLFAARILTISGRSVRPWAPFRKLTLPPATIIALILAIICAFLMTGILGLIAKTAAATLVIVYVLLGLAVFHDLVHGHAMRMVALVGIYFVLLTFSGLAVLPLIALALAETFLGLRARKAAASNNNST
ncbi:MAG: DUF2232 domain-containing protein [Hyphomicrobiales bacterium]